MNVTGNIQCDICKTSHGFSSADQRAIIVMTVLVAIALVFCYVGVLWFAIRTRFKLSKNSNVIDHTMHKNETFNNDDEENFDEYVQPIENIRSPLPPTTSTQHVYFKTEKE
ncbi:unnamed protein product [Rotaria sordida]|uniref:Uncharacterized protein n=1 Tax=Rotaria sordida TaxID=392033 RepID=A0A814R2F8_9BILA|nr:unnamed protein product [Rotaria sordida]CAF1350192.1 unnamed protein product [Rotaria sordida]